MKPQTTVGPAPGPLDGPSLRFLPRVPRAAAILIPKLLRNPLDFLSGMARDYGDVVCVGIYPINVILINHPDHIKHVLQDNHVNYIKGPSYAFLKVLLEDGLLVTDGEVWRRQRRLAQPAFSREQHRAIFESMVAATAALIERWTIVAERGQSISLRAEMIKLTLDILLRSIFSASLGEHAERLSRAFTTTDSFLDLASSMNPLRPPLWVPTPKNRRFLKARRIQDDFIYHLIAERRDSGQRTGDLLSMLLDTRDEETGQGLTDGEVRNLVMSAMQGGHGPQSDALTWTMYLLSQNSSVLRRVQEELATVFGGRTPTFEDLPKLSYTTLMFQEVLRLYPSAWVVGRTAVKDDQIGGYTIPAKSLVVLSPYVTHRDPKWWDDPERFDPDRFLPQNLEKRDRFTYFPFAAGPRICIGRDFGNMETMLILSMVAQVFELELVPGPPIRPVTRFGLEPNRPIMMNVREHARRAEPATA